METKKIVTFTKDLTPTLAMKLVNVLGNFESSIKMKYRNKTVDAKSILGLVSLSVPSNQEVELIVEGDDREEAINKFIEICVD
ncbi:HPr family phosphocarrier protein [Haloplasma contractile]|uniref:HPr-like protein Crh n=1 Tax=Haloplasma contractile SSD-17B TaxID=1033810 RepID=U2DVC9_9MOLU|nr:HPr family phosphocarrier protein [Haloplasma contractile]ERJ12347.1 HPr-like protein Crh [Haloplasma contractile SSD-17B]